MAVKLHQFTVTLCLQAPVITQSAGARAHGLDSAFWKYQDTEALPGTLVRGNLRHALSYFAANGAEKSLNNKISRWFGEASASAGQDEKEQEENNYDPKSGNLHFDYAWQLNDATEFGSNDQNIRTRIQMDKESGAVKHGSIQTIENRFALGEKLVFSGTLRLMGDEQEAKTLMQWLSKALEYLPAMGAMKGAGFGKLINSECSIKEKPTRLNKAAKLAIEVEQLQLQLTFSSPFCIAPRALNDSNRFESLDYIPGNVIKGALAQYCFQKKSKDLKACGFDHWHIGHARPCQAIEAQAELTQLKPSCALPASLVTTSNDAGDDTIYDLALPSAGDPEAIFLFNDKAPAFKTDWKDKHKALAYQAMQVSPLMVDKTLSLHTAITEGKNYAKLNGLFSQEDVLSYNEKGALSWCATMDISRLSEQEKTQTLEKLQVIATTGIPGIGRTKAWAQVTLIGAPRIPPVLTRNIDENNKNLFVVTLQSDALLLPRQPGEALKATNDANSLQQYYKDYWQDKSGKSLALVNYFATQRRVGGAYFHHYYQRKRDGQARYHPDWLTEAGSVFILRVNDNSVLNEAEDKLQNWLNLGLPVHADYSDYSWQHTPYLRENGYGEIKVNQPCHSELNPQNDIDESKLTLWRGGLTNV